MNYSYLFNPGKPGLQGIRFIDLFILLFFFQSSFFLLIKLGLFLLFLFAFILFSLITHICFSLLENDLRRTVAPNVCRQAVSDFFADFLSYRFRVSYYY